MRSFQACQKENEKYVTVSQSTDVTRLPWGTAERTGEVDEIGVGLLVQGNPGL